MTLSSPYEPSFEEVQDAFERQMKCSLIGPQDIERFLDTFLPLPGDVDPNSIPLLDLSDALIDGREKNANADLVDALGAPEFERKGTNTPSGHPNHMKPILCEYQVLDFQHGTGRLLVPYLVSSEVKTEFDDMDDIALREHQQGFEETSSTHKGGGCDQASNYAAYMMSSYPHIFLFAVLIFGDRARLLRLDRSGGILTTSFDYKSQDYLSQLLFRFSKLDAYQRGLDPTTIIATPAEKELLSNSLAEYRARLAPRNTDYLDPTLDPLFPAYKVNVRSKTLIDEDIEFDLIIQFPFSDYNSLVGRYTRGYAAYHVQEERLVFLKDYWRVDDATTDSEVEMYKRLFAGDSDVTGLPDIIALGDVIHDGHLQTAPTQGPTDVDDPEPQFLGSRKPNTLVHVRVVQELAIPLDSALNSKEVVETVYDAVVCIGGAFSLNILHRDVSAKNVMIRDPTNPARLRYSRRRTIGILNDWDHAIYTTNDIARGNRTGTWEFMSIKLLRYPERLHEVHDDLESVYWVLAYTALHRFKQTGPTKFNMRCFSEMDFSSPSGEFSFVKGGVSKTIVLLDRRLATIEFSSLPARGVLSELTFLFAGYSIYLPADGVFLEEDDDPDRARFPAHYQRIGDPRNIAAIIEHYINLPDHEWDLNDWETVDKYPPFVRSTTEEARAMIMKFARPGPGFQSSDSRSGAKATESSDSQRHRQDPPHSQSASMLPIVTLRKPTSSSSDWQSADVLDTPHSNKRPLVTDESSTSANKQARVGDASDVKRLLAIIRDLDLQIAQRQREASYLELQIVARDRSSDTLGAGNSPQNSVGNDVHDVGHSQSASTLPTLRSNPHNSASASSTSSIWQSADVPDTPHSNKRSMVADGSFTPANKKARTTDDCKVKAANLEQIDPELIRKELALAEEDLALTQRDLTLTKKEFTLTQRDTVLGQRQKRLQNQHLSYNSQVATQGQCQDVFGIEGSAPNSTGNDLGHLGLELPYEDSEFVRSGPPSTYATSCNSSPPSSIKNLPNKEEDTVDTKNSSTLPVFRNIVGDQSD